MVRSARGESPSTWPAFRTPQGALIPLTSYQTPDARVKPRRHRVIPARGGTNSREIVT